MKHASAHSLAQLDGLLVELRALHGLTERTPGCFYRKGAAFLHFHEDPAGLFADVKLKAQGFDRRRVSTAAEQRALWLEVRALVS